MLESSLRPLKQCCGQYGFSLEVEVRIDTEIE